MNDEELKQLGQVMEKIINEQPAEEAPKPLGVNVSDGIGAGETLS